MPAKYSDRFLKPQEPGRDVLDLVGSAQRSSLGSPGAVDQVEDELDHDPPRGPRWHQSGALRLTLVFAVLVGAGGGAFGWDRWRAHQADVVARHAIDLVTSASTATSYPSGDVLEATLRYRNEGEHPILIREVAFDTDSLVPVDEPDPLTVAPGATEEQDISVRAVCPTDGGGGVGYWPDDTPRLVVQAETVDGAVREHRLPSGLPFNVVEWMSYTCDRAQYTPVFTESYTEIMSVIPGDDGATVRADFQVGFGDEVVDVHVEAVETSTPAFVVDFAMASAPSVPTFSASLVATFRVQDCAAALAATEADMTLAVTGAVGATQPGTTYVWPDADLAVELLRLAGRTCGPA